MTCSRSKLRGEFLQNSLYNMVDSIIGYCLASRISMSLSHRLSSTVESVALYFTTVLLYSRWAFIKMTKEMNTPVPKLRGCQECANRFKSKQARSHIHLWLTGKQREETDYLQGQDGTQIRFSSWPLKCWHFHLLIVLHVLHSRLASHSK